MAVLQNSENESNILHWRISMSDDDTEIDNEDELLRSMVRRTYLYHLKQCLRKNLEKLNQVENFEEKIFNRVIKNCCSFLEEKALRRCMISRLYQRVMATIIKEIKTCTVESKIFPTLKTFVETPVTETLFHDKGTQTNAEWQSKINNQLELCELVNAPVIDPIQARTLLEGIVLVAASSLNSINNSALLSQTNASNQLNVTNVPSQLNAGNLPDHVSNPVSQLVSIGIKDVITSINNDNSESVNTISKTNIINNESVANDKAVKDEELLEKISRSTSDEIVNNETDCYNSCPNPPRNIILENKELAQDNISNKFVRLEDTNRGDTVQNEICDTNEEIGSVDKQLNDPVSTGNQKFSVNINGVEKKFSIKKKREYTLDEKLERLGLANEPFVPSSYLPDFSHAIQNMKPECGIFGTKNDLKDSSSQEVASGKIDKYPSSNLNSEKKKFDTKLTNLVFTESVALMYYLECELSELCPAKRLKVDSHYESVFGPDHDTDHYNLTDEQKLLACRKRITSIVVLELTAFYNKNRIASKQLFKNMAKYITMVVLNNSLYPDPEDIRQNIKQFFPDNVIISSESDYRSM